MNPSAVPFQVPLKFLLPAAYFIFPVLLSAATLTNPISVAEKDQARPAAASRSSGSGAVFAWEDNRSGNSDIYAQLLCGCDSASWKTDGLPVCSAGGNQRHPVIIGDTSEGAIIAWEDARNGTVNIYAQRVNRHGAMLWAENGVPLGSSAFDQKNPVIVADSSGGAIIVWEDARNGADSPDIYAQRISQDGVLLWDSGGAAVSKQAGAQLEPRLICNLKGGAIVSWQDHRYGDNDIYAQSLDPSGMPKWEAGGVGIATKNAEQARPRLVGDGLGGGIIVWNDFRSTQDWDIFAQRIDADGQAKWKPDGLCMNNHMTGDQLDPVIDMDGDGGAIVVWADKRSGNFDIYGQRIDGSGSLLWDSSGAPICTAPGDQGDPQIVRLYRGGASVAWVDSRNPESSISTQAITAGGGRLLSGEGMVISTSAHGQINPAIVSDGDEGIIAVWQDLRNSDFDIYSRIVPGQVLALPREPVSRGLIRSRPGLVNVSPSGEIRYSVERAGRVSLEILDLSGHRLATLVNGFQNSGGYSIATANRSAGGFGNGIYLCRFKTGDVESVNKISLIL